MLMLAQLWNWLKSDERGQGLAEYGLIILLVALAAVVAITALGGQLATLFQTITGALTPTP